jgi:hypothetical protein
MVRFRHGVEEEALIADGGSGRLQGLWTGFHCCCGDRLPFAIAMDLPQSTVEGHHPRHGDSW